MSDLFYHKEWDKIKFLFVYGNWNSIYHTFAGGLNRAFLKKYYTLLIKKLELILLI